MRSLSQLALQSKDPQLVREAVNSLVSPRQRQIWEAYAKGEQPSAIAERLGISKKTLDMHICILAKDDVTKGDAMVHAWGYVKALEYLTELAPIITADVANSPCG